MTVIDYDNNERERERERERDTEIQRERETDRQTDRDFKNVRIGKWSLVVMISFPYQFEKEQHKIECNSYEKK